jgi:lipopolysaccharide heptosyltransferase I
MPTRTRPPLREYRARRIGLIKPSAFGDIVHSLPVLTALRRRYPGAYIAWVINRAYEPLLRDHPHLDAVIPFDRGLLRHGWLSAVGRYFRFLDELRAQRFDLVIDLQGLLRSGIMCAATGARRRVGLRSAREGASWFYTDVLDRTDGECGHAVDRYWRVAEELGVGDGPPVCHVPVAEDARRWVEQTLGELPRPWLMLGVGSRWQTKRWPPEHYADLARLAQSHFGGTVFFVGGADEKHLSQATAVRLAGPRRDLTGETTLPQLVALLAQADVMVANDTGPLHLAAALGRPVIAPYTCTKVPLTGPYGQLDNAVAAGVWCQGSCRKHCERLDCMKELTAARLWPLLRGVLQQWQTSRDHSRSA